ncbi:Uma2 family endonuclease [Actinoplanes sp. NPDC051494]|uniref:Uma2 family endonuclease n=1 Tax=Actinoplanes sp. NPDC051494 TaxID=3363907 RepID=UPI0037B9B075
MTAEPTTPVMWTPDPVRQRTAGHFLEDVLNLPDDAPRVELLDGVMIVVPSPTIGHQNIGNLLWAWLRQHAPDTFLAVTAVGVAVGMRDSLEPDVLLLRQPVASGNHYVLPSQVVIAVEIVSPGTRRRDRLEKPALYAAAGIPHFWRIEQDPLRVFAYDLVDGRYEAAGEAGAELVLSAPFEIKLPIRDIAP